MSFDLLPKYVIIRSVGKMGVGVRECEEVYDCNRKTAMSALPNIVTQVTQYISKCSKPLVICRAQTHINI